MSEHSANREKVIWSFRPSSNEVYKTITGDFHIAEEEARVMLFWKQEEIFKKSLKSETGKDFIFYDGPPFANGMPHYGHLLTGFAKDAVARHRTMKDMYVERRFGWDCHGLPAEMGAEKELKVSGRKAVENYGIDKFNKHCRNSVMKYAKAWEEYVERQGRWVDFENDYKTMNIEYMETTMWCFAELYKKGLIYKAMRVLPYSWACQTPLSNFETRMDNSYRNRIDKTVIIGYEAKSTPSFAPPGTNRFFLPAWTTAPWTTVPTLALAVNPNMEYKIIISGDCSFAVGAFAADELMQKIESFTKEKASLAPVTLNGKAFEGIKFKPIFDFYVDFSPKAFIVGCGDFVQEGSGTGIVQCAPDFGEEDFNFCADLGIEAMNPVDDAACFRTGAGEFTGKNVFEANEIVLLRLKEKGIRINVDQISHSYPHCWRTDEPLIYRAMSSWYVAVSKVKKNLQDASAQIRWIPENAGNSFLQWLEGVRDWSISRNRFWGTPIPVWESDNPSFPRIDVYGSLDDIERDFGVRPSDIHRPYCDNLIRPNPDDPSGKTMMRRTSHVFDCWFESGAMPYGQIHYPFCGENKLKKAFPADFVAEYTSQTRGWFYTMNVLSAAIFNKPAFKNCICHGVVLDAEGKKLSKRLNNYVDPMEAMNKYGADSVRRHMLSSSVMHGGELMMDKEGNCFAESLRNGIKPLLNAYSFFATYANADKKSGIIDYSGLLSDGEIAPVMDLYILKKAYLAATAADSAMTEFNFRDTYFIADKFFDTLNNWYIRRNRKRFWNSEETPTKVSARNVLKTVLHLVCKAFAPIMPFTTEMVYLRLCGESVHLSLLDFSNASLSQKAADFFEKEKIEERMDEIKAACITALSLRNEAGEKVRIPLNEMKIIRKKDAVPLGKELLNTAAEELNIKNVTESFELEAFADRKIKINFPAIGNRIPGSVKNISKAIQSNAWEILDNGSLSIAGEKLTSDEFSIYLTPKNQGQGYKAVEGFESMIWVDLNVTKELRAEGMARDLVRFIQSERKAENLDVSDRIHLELLTNSHDSIEIASKFADYIKEQTLAISLKTTITESMPGLKVYAIDNNGSVAIRINKDN